ncbi:unnamed protein product [Acanthosepion pharaonis]|uniref:Uncharacterized protein n=1 Tax=Acanthosepion pharaonis TaxID=158019 RepID=A0A812BWN5_ACAPH|nr:unnamed protein product [Sepia pharaonis]
MRFVELDCFSSFSTSSSLPSAAASYSHTPIIIPPHPHIQPSLRGPTVKADNQSECGNDVIYMASPPVPKKHESKPIVASIERPVEHDNVPPIQLEQREITMSQPFEHHRPLPCIVTTTVDGAEGTEEDAEMLVGGETMGNVPALAAGIGRAVSLEAQAAAAATETSSKDQLATMGETETQRGQTSPDQPSPKRNSAHIMEFFEEQEKSFQEHFRTLPKPIKIKKTRSPSPSMMRQSVGLDHLDNLVRLMEQLTNLRDENNRLKKKCAYLESTKYLLQVKSEMSDDRAPLGYMSLPSKAKQKQQKAIKDSSEGDFSPSSSDPPRQRLSSVDSSQTIEVIETASDQTPKRPKTTKLYKRSFSTGSLEIPSDIMEQDISEECNIVIVSDYDSKDSKPGSKSPCSKKKSTKFSKWARVKKILTRQKLMDDSGSGMKVVKDGGKPGQSQQAAPESSTRELTVPIVGLTETRSMDSGVSSGADGDGREALRTSTSSGGPPSPSPLAKVPPAEEDSHTEMWMAPPRSWEEGIKSESSGKVTDSQGQYLNVKTLVRRQSSPSLVVEAGDGANKSPDEDSASPRLHRSASYKVPGSGERASSRDKKCYKTAWGRVKGIIHTRKDSSKKKHKKSEKIFTSEEPSETDIEVEDGLIYSSPKLSELAKKQLGLSSVSKVGTPQTSPRLSHQQSSVKSSGSESSKSRSSSAKKNLPGTGNVDMAALVGGMSDDFTKKMKQWEELRSKQTTAASKRPSPLQKLRWEFGISSEGTSDGVSSSADITSPPNVNVDEIQRPLADYKITDEFAHKLYEWERMKGLSHELSAALYREVKKRGLQGDPPPRASTSSTTPAIPTMAAAAAATATPADTPGQEKEHKQKPSPLNLTPSWDSPDEASPVDRCFPHSSSDTSMDESATTESSMTKSNISSLENAHLRLLQELEEKKQEYVKIQQSVKELHVKLEKFKDAHSKEIVRYKKQIPVDRKPAGKLKEEQSGALISAMHELEGKIQELEHSGEKLQLSMESAAMCKLQSMEGEENISSRLMELMEQMKLMLAEASQTEEVSKKSSALNNFEKFYCHAMQLQIQMNNLRLSHLERNKEIMEMKRQLLLQEVNNLLLQADITRRESELYQFQETRRSVQLKRWNTYHGGNLESRPRVACRREYDDKTLLHRFVSMKERSKEIYSDPDSQSAQEAALSDTTGRSLGAFKSNLAGSLTEVRLEGDSPRAVLNNSTPELHFRSTSTPFIDSLAMEDREAGASPLGPVRTAPEGETQISTPVSTLGHTDAETISRIPDGASEETDYVSPVSHSVQDPDQSHLQISFTISLATMNVQMPQTIATSTHEPTSINSQCMLCKTASSAQRHATSTTPGPGLDPAKVSVDSSTADHINKFHQGETLADWLKREPKCPELLLPESSPDLEGMTTVKPLFVDETPSASAIPPGGEQSVSKPKEPVPYKKSALKKSKAAPLAKSEDLSDKSKATRQETEGSEWTSQSSLIGPWAPPTERSSHVPQTTLNVSTEKQTLKELKPKHEKTTKTEKIGPFSETPLLKLSRSTSPSSQTSVCPPQVGIVSPIRRLKPATELLEECQKYRMGHTAYRTRSHLRGARTEDVDKKPPQEASAKKTQDKENMSEGFVHVLAKRLSDEEMPTPSAGSNDSTPKAGSVISLHHSDSPHSLTEIGYHIVCNIPSGQSEPTLLSQQSTQVQTAKAGAPLKEVTKGEKVKSVKIVNGKGTTQESSTTMPTRRRSFEIPKSSEFQPEYQAQSSSSTNLDGRTIDEGKPDSTISVSNSFSMPVLSSAEVQGDGARKIIQSFKVRKTKQRIHHYNSGVYHIGRLQLMRGENPANSYVMPSAKVWKGVSAALVKQNPNLEKVRCLIPRIFL